MVYRLKFLNQKALVEYVFSKFQMSARTAWLALSVKLSLQPSVILTDGWKGYAGLGVHGYTHDKIVLSDSGDPAHVALPGVHRIASLLKRWLLGS